MVVILKLKAIVRYHKEIVTNWLKKSKINQHQLQLMLITGHTILEVFILLVDVVMI